MSVALLLQYFILGQLSSYRIGLDKLSCISFDLIMIKLLVFNMCQSDM